MLTHLLIMRHAKSSWSEGRLSDHERPLNMRGEKSAEAMGAALHARGYAPNIIWSSDATRTRQTAMRLIRAIPGAQTVEYSADLYHASATQALSICGRQIEPDGRLMLLGHNPGWAELHHYFTGRNDDFPTAACTVLTRTDKGDGDWLTPKSWRMVDFILPRDLLA